MGRRSNPRASAAATVCLPAGPGLLLCLPIAGPDLEGKTRLDDDAVVDPQLRVRGLGVARWH